MRMRILMTLSIKVDHTMVNIKMKMILLKKMKMISKSVSGG